MQNRRNIFIFTNGCARRGLDVTRLTRYFELNGCAIVDKLQEADYIIFSTCAFKKSKEEECFRYIAEFDKYKGELIIVDCLPDIAPARFNKIFKGKYVSTKNLQEIDRIFADFQVKFLDVSDANFLPDNYNYSPYSLSERIFVNFELSKKFFRRCVQFMKRRVTLAITLITPRTRKKDLPQVLLRVANGCVDRCAYCCIYRAVGKLRSKPLDLCLEEYKKLLNEGYYRFLLLADNVGAYGLDINSSFSELLEKLSNIDKNFKVKWEIQELHPKWIIKYKSELLKRVKEGKITKILCPIQSGSNRILNLMNRHHTIEDIASVFLELKQANPHLVLFTHVIIGFPSETEDDFHATLDSIKKMKLDEVTLYPYHEGEDTDASKLDNKIEEAVIKSRIRLARKILQKNKIKCFLESEDLLAL